MIKMIATDLDGTLFRDDKTFNEEFYNLFHLLNDRGIKFVIATGNQYPLVRDKFKRIKDDIVYVVENGNKIVYQNNVLHTSILTKEDKDYILDILMLFQDIMILYCGVDHTYIHRRFQKNEDFIKTYYKEYIFIDNYKDIQEDIMKFSMADFKGQPHLYVNQIKDKLPHHIQIVTTGHHWFDIFNKNVNKGTAITFLQDFFKINRSECMAFGDQMNDYDLLLSCEESYAMANAKNELKQIAKHIAKSNEEDGVIEVLKTLI